ncbi:oxidoreductase [Candidatus Marinamargulisbacteria bacterium SCGC AG-333-B06]|nr:oxidoreductase [Candidatus Marinamargulisbacteria bacterium SCGC AG-333-B06]
MNTKVCCIGAGRWGKNHIRTANELGVLGAVIDSNPESIAFIQKTYPHVEVFSSLNEKGALNYTAYIVAVPAEYHFDVARTLIEHKKHVLVEKPITLDVAEAKILEEYAKNQGVQLMVGHLLLFHPAFKKIKELLSTGKLGKLQYMYSNRLNLGTVRTEENSLWSFAPHDFSLFQYLTNSKPLDVISNGGAFLQPHIHDTTMTVVRYPSNIVGHIFVSWLHPFKEHRFVVIGSKGMLVYEDSSLDKELLFYEKGIDWVNGEPVKRDGPTQKISYEVSQPLRDELLHFIACIEGKEDNTIINAKKGTDVLELLARAQVCLENEFQRV